MNAYCLRILCSLLAYTACKGQIDQSQYIDQSTPIIGGPCDGCDLLYLGIPKHITDIDTSRAWRNAATKLEISGTVYRLDGTTPAPGVIIYYWQTNEQGVYAAADQQLSRTVRHGQLRGWVRSNAEGAYRIYTCRPGPYPQSDIPAHLHFFVKEPDLATVYYIDDVFFDDDPLLTATWRDRAENRGGNGISAVSSEGDRQTVKRDVLLGYRIPNYAK